MKAHPTAIVETDQVGEGTRIHAFTHLMEGASVGKNCKISDHVFIEGGAKVGNGVTIKNGISIWEKVTIEDDVFLGPHAVFTNVLKPRAFRKTPREEFSPTLVRQGATVGAGAVIVCGITIGRYAFVAAGAVVTRSVPDHGLVRGNPARLVAYVCRCTSVRWKPEEAPRTCPECAV